MTYGRVSEFCVGSINKSESVAGLAGSIASVFSKHIITACRTFRSMICVLIIITHRHPPQCHHNFHLQRDKVCCVNAHPAEHGIVRWTRRLSHHLRLSTKVTKNLEKATKMDDFDKHMSSQVIHKQPSCKLHRLRQCDHMLK